MSGQAGWKFWRRLRRASFSSSSISSRRLRAITLPSSRCCRKATTLTCQWLMHGPAPFMSKLMQVFMNMDKMIGKDFEAGLANLKKLAER